MAKTVREIMNAELFSVREDERARDVVRYFLTLGVTAAPVLDSEHRPCGFLSLRDTIRASEDAKVRDVMSVPVDAVEADASLEDAADLLADRNRHHLPVVDFEGRAMGFVSVLDVMRALRGRPAQHPATFPHHDPVTGLTWTDPRQFDDAAVMQAPAGPGLYALMLCQPRERDRTVWSEASANVQARLRELLHSPRCAPPHLASHLERHTLFVRFAPAPSSRALYETLRAHSP